MDAGRVKVMAPTLGNDRDEELEHLRSWCLAIIQFMARLSPSNALRDAEDVVNSTFERRDLNGLRMMCRDMRQWTKGLSAVDRIKLEGALQSTCGVGLVETSNSEQDALSQILKRGRVDGEEEYRILSDRADDIHEDSSKRSELKRINSLLAAYERSRSRHQ